MVTLDDIKRLFTTLEDYEKSFKKETITKIIELKIIPKKRVKVN